MCTLAKAETYIYEKKALWIRDSNCPNLSVFLDKQNFTEWLMDLETLVIRRTRQKQSCGENKQINSFWKKVSAINLPMEYKQMVRSAESSLVWA